MKDDDGSFRCSWVVGNSLWWPVNTEWIRCLACYRPGLRVDTERQNPSGYEEEIPGWEAKYYNGFMVGS